MSKINYRKVENMKKIILVTVVLLLSLTAPLQSTSAQIRGENSDFTAARKARDRASVEELQKIIAKTKKEAAENNSPEAYLRLALFHVWLCEAIESSQKNDLFKQAAEDGVVAAEKAVALNPNSSEAHQLLGDLLNQLIPHVFGGGMRYGTRATDEIEKALELNPKNVDALVSRSIIYYYTPDNFGGSRQKAFDMLERAVEVDTKADSPHIWLAFFYLDAKKSRNAFKHISVARGINPKRTFTNYVYGEVSKSLKTPKTGKKSSQKSAIKGGRSK
jgi:tetratricopeptide (TPR) repeat protein